MTGANKVDTLSVWLEILGLVCNNRDCIGSKHSL